MNAMAQLGLPPAPDAALDLHARGRRAAAGLCAGLWFIAFCFYETPTLLYGRSTPIILGFQVACALTGMTLCWGLFLLIRATRRLERPLQGAIVGAAALAALLAHSASDTVIFKALAPDVLARVPNTVLGREGTMFFTNALQLCAVYVLFLAGVALIFSMLAIQERERSLARERAAAQEAQLAALRFQINPHFLFNALNAVTALVASGRNAEAEAVVTRLSEFFRASLITSPAALLPLEDELDVAGAYLDIESARFGPRLLMDVDFTDEVRGALVPHVLLQPLVENAVKYGVALSKRPVTVSIRAWSEGQTLFVAVRDDGEGGLTSGVRGAGVGLANVQARLEAMFGAEAALRTRRLSPGFEAQVRLPLRTATQHHKEAELCAS